MRTQHELILDYIRTQGAITPMQAFNDLGITKLATRVSEMIRLGVPIKKEPQSYKLADGTVMRFMQYRLEEKM